MNLLKVAEYVWENSEEIEFGETKMWDLETFSAKWFREKDVKRLNKMKGWYWFAIDNMSIQNIKNIKKPQKFPKNGADFPRISKKMDEVFGENIRQVEGDELIIYNGHASSIFDRIKTHFSLNNDKTGALALAKYDLSNYKLKIRFFHMDLLNDKDVEEEFKNYLNKIVNEKTGREAIEMAWRIKYGWPILCEK
ncbi:MAG: hypothetical protein RSE41_08460 [Clostridia bacterium]